MQNELNELRNQVRTLKRVVYGAFGLMLVGGLLAATSLQSVPDVIQAKKFEVLNKNGKVSVSLESLNDSMAKSVDGCGVIKVLDANGLPGIQMSCGISGGWLSVFGTGSESPLLVSLAAPATDDGGTWLGGFSIRHLPGKNIVEMTMTPEGDGIVKTFDKAGAVTSTTP